MEITRDIIYIGVNDHRIDLFEGQYKVPNGMSYNSYLILDEKTAVMDTVDRNFTHEWLDNLGLEVPTTYQEFEDVLTAFKEQDANGNGDPNIDTRADRISRNPVEERIPLDYDAAMKIFRDKEDYELEWAIQYLEKR